MVSKRILLVGIVLALVVGAGVGHAQSRYYSPYTGRYQLPGAYSKWVMEDVLNNLVNGGGVMIAAAHVDGVPAVPVVTRSQKNLPGFQPVTVTRLGVGTYDVDFGASVAGRYYAGVQGEANFGTPTGGWVEVTPRVLDPNSLYVETYDNTGTLVDTPFYVMVW